VSKTVQVGEYFVVGGPVQSDRPCYVKRAADDRLYQMIADERFSFVLSPKATGKSSLMARAIRRLRSEGQLAAVVDLTQIGARSEGSDAGRWYYSIAYRIVRELRLKVDLQAWWHDKNALLSEQRLVEFFGDIVLANTSVLVTIFIDEADRAIDLPFASELFVAIRSCYMRRISGPEYSRLNFVVLGVATPEQLCPDAGLSPFTDGAAVNLNDFSLAEAEQLAPGFNGDDEMARRIITAIHRWTGGQPYLTQKIARSIARKSATDNEVDQTVRELLLAPARLREEPLLSHIRSELDKVDKVTRQALVLLGKIAAGAAVQPDPRSAARMMLERIGIVAVQADGTLHYRNTVFERVFDGSFSKSTMPFNWRRPALIAASALIFLGLPYWYTQVVPRPYIATLSVVSQDYVLAEEAYRRLRRLPGFAGSADRLLAAAMVRRSERTNTFGEVLAADAVLRSLPDEEPLADRTLAGFWLRQANTAMHEGDRDAALIYAIAAQHGQPDHARALAVELIDIDYQYLEATFRMPGRPVSWDLDWERDQIVFIDESRQVQYLTLGAEANPQDPNALVRVPSRLTAVQHVALERELTVDADGTAGAFDLLLTTQHARASDLMLRLTAPSGAQAEILVPQPRADQQQLIFSARRGSPLSLLVAEQVRGQWALTVVDRRSGEQGVLTSWGMQFPASSVVWMDTPEQGISLPDPVRTEQVDVELAAGGRAAVAVPSRLGVAGAISVWDLGEGRLRADLEIQSAPDFVRLLNDGAQLLTVTGGELTIWDVDGGDAIARIETAFEFAADPAISPDERYVAIAEAEDESAVALTLVEIETGEIAGRAKVDGRIEDWALAAGGRYVAIVDGSRRIRLVDPLTGSVLGDGTHERRLSRLAPLTQADFLVAVDADQAVIGWPVDAAAKDVTVGEAIFLGMTTNAESIAVAGRARRVVFAGAADRIEIRELNNGRLRGNALRVDSPDRLRVSAAGDQIVVEGNGVLRRWRLPGRSLLGAESLALSAAALEHDGSLAALGYRAGHIRILAPSESATSAASDTGIDYIGHRGSVTSIALNAEQGIAASGGADGVVRIWDLTTVAPNEYFLRHPAGPVQALQISADGRWIASGAEYSARLWHTQTGELASEVPVSGTALAVALAPTVDLVAVGDSAGNIFLGAPSGSETLRSALTRAAVTAIAFSPDSSLMASGDQDGNLVLWDVSATEVTLGAYDFSEPVTWIQFAADASSIVVRAGKWLHFVERAEVGLRVIATRMLPIQLGGAQTVAGAPNGTFWTLETSTGRGPALRALQTGTDAAVDPLAAEPLISRNWAGIVGLELDVTTGSVGIARN
jgi:WD40 repeat protein/subtilisin-like proprotein convertase family protein